jgi:hypothetical protein
MEQSGQWSKGTGKENPRPPLCDGRQPRFARLVRGSSRRITIVKASSCSILEYQSDQPSRPLLDHCSLCSKPSATQGRTGRQIFC